jgi:hypothetical protein
LNESSYQFYCVGATPFRRETRSRGERNPNIEDMPHGNGVPRDNPLHPSRESGDGRRELEAQENRGSLQVAGSQYHDENQNDSENSDRSELKSENSSGIESWSYFGCRSNRTTLS